MSETLKHPLILEAFGTFHHNDWNRRSRRPYPAVVAVEFEGERVVGNHFPQEKGVGSEEFRRARTIELMVPPELGIGCISFFERFFTKGARTTSDPYQDQYNCRRFAYWMGEDPLAEDAGCPVAGAGIIIRDGESVTEATMSGQHISIGRRNVLSLIAHNHSMVGTGDEHGRCLEVREANGFMSVSTVQERLTHFQTTEDPAIKAYALPL